MRKHIKVHSSDLLSHCDDTAFDLLDRLEELLARMVATPGSRFLRERIHRSSARLAEKIILSSDPEPRQQSRAQRDPAQLLCRVVHGMLKLVRRYRVLDSDDHEKALALARELIRVLKGRHLGVEIVVDDESEAAVPTANGLPDCQTAAPVDPATSPYKKPADA